MKKISIIVSVYNEESALRQFYGESKPIFDALPWDYELLFVNDGSSDGSLAILKEFCGPGSEGEAGEFLQELRP